MTRETVARFNGLNTEYQGIVADFIDFLAIRQFNRDKTMKVIEEANNGIDLSEPFDDVDDLMEALNA